MSQQPKDPQQEDRGKKKKNQIIFVVSSFAALVIVGFVGYAILSKVRENKNLATELLQEQFEGDPQVSSQLQSECQNSANKIAKTQDAALMETEYRQNAENCKDTSISVEFPSFVRKEGNYGDIVVDIAKQVAKADKIKAIDLLKYARDLKTWDFYLGPTSCESQHVLEAYIESFSSTEEKVCLKQADIQAQVIPAMNSKNFTALSKFVAPNDVVWLGAPESELGCPEKISSVVEILKKLTPGTVTSEIAPVEASEEAPQVNVTIKLSDKENVTLVLQGESQDCLSLSSVLVPNPEVSE